MDFSLAARNKQMAAPMHIIPRRADRQFESKAAEDQISGKTLHQMYSFFQAGYDEGMDEDKFRSLLQMGHGRAILYAQKP